MHRIYSARRSPHLLLLLATAGAATPLQAAQLEVGPGQPYTTVQAAVAAALDGDVVNVAAGVYVEQVTITKGITLQGAGTDLTTIQAPAAASLVQSGGDWKNLKAQDVFAIIGVKSAAPVTIRNLTVDGNNQGYLPDITYGDKTLYAFEGISIFNTNAQIDAVHVTRVRELSTDYGNTPENLPPVDYPALPQPAGMNHNEGIMLEGSAGSPASTVTITHSKVSEFQKTAILAWGPTLTVNIDSNTIQGYGATLYSTGNAIQIGSSDLTFLGGAYGDRRGTYATVTNNQILDLGLLIPPLGEPGYYFNPGLYGPAGVLLWEAADGVTITGNTIASTLYQPSWHSSVTSADGGWATQAISIYNSPNVVITDNVLSGLEIGVAEDSSVPGSVLHIGNNSGSNYVADVWGSAGNDQIELAPTGNQVVAFGQTDNGIDTLSNLLVGDALYVIGYAYDGPTPSVNGELNGTPVVDFSGGTVTAGDGSNVAGHSVQITTGTTTQLYADTEGDSDAAELTVELTGSYGPDNFALAGGKITVVAAAPAATTGATSLQESSSAHLSGSVRDYGAATTASFEYGTTTSYGMTLAAAESPLAGVFASSSVGVDLTGLSCETTYHYRLVANNSEGTSYGDDRTFITATCPVTITGPNPGGSGDISASLSGGGSGRWIFAPSGNGIDETAGFIPLSGHPKSPGVTPPLGYLFAYGLFDFVLIEGEAGSAASLTITYPEALPEGSEFLMFGATTSNPTPHWYRYPSAVVSGNSVTLSVTDGGSGDGELTANSLIRGQGGVAYISATAVPTLTPWALLLLAAGLATVVARRRLS